MWESPGWDFKKQLLELHEGVEIEGREEGTYMFLAAVRGNPLTPRYLKKMLRSHAYAKPTTNTASATMSFNIFYWGLEPVLHARRSPQNYNLL